MWHVKSSYGTLADGQLGGIINNQRNLAQAQSVLSLYERNNRDLMGRVYDLTQENEMLRRKTQEMCLKTSSYTSFGMRHLPVRRNQHLQSDYTNRITAKKQSRLRGNNKLYHPRNAYLTPQQVENLNIRVSKQVKTAQKESNHNQEYKRVKQKLSDKKQNLNKSYKSKQSLCPSRNMSMSRNVYLDEPSSEVLCLDWKQPLQQHRYSNCKLTVQGSHEKMDVEKLNVNRLNKEIVYHSPVKCVNGHYERGGFTQRQRPASTVKVQDVYPQNIIRIQEPTIKWKDLSHTQFGRSTPLKKQAQQERNTRRLCRTIDVAKRDQNLKRQKKKFLKVISQSHQKPKYYLKQ